jgi:hypothetical protein
VDQDRLLCSTFYVLRLLCSMYIDDILILGSTYTICLQNTMEALHLLIRARFIIYWEKSSLTTSTDFPFLGFQLLLLLLEGTSQLYTWPFDILG